MNSLCFEIKTKCKHCETPLMLNALEEDVLCSTCNKTNKFDAETWSGLLEDSFKAYGEMGEGEGQTSTVFRGEYNYGMMYGRQNPRCQKCKTPLDMNKLEEYSKAGFAACSKCGNQVSVRKTPDFVAKAMPKVKYLAGEDTVLFSVNPTGAAIQNASHPVLFTCPSCAGNLEIDGSNRMIKCKFCSSEIYLPDDLWFRLHPVKEVERWYAVFDEFSPEEGLIDWYYIPGFVIDKQGLCYVASSDTDNKDFRVWSFGPDLKTRWVRKGMKFKEDKAGMCLSNDGNLYLWSPDKHSLLILSAKDGSTIGKIEGKPATGEEKYTFSLKGCSTMVSDHDGSILALVNNELARFNTKGERIELWSGKFLGIFGTGLGNPIPEKDAEWAACVKEIKSRPKRIDSDLTKMNIGWDGYLYMIDSSSSDGVIARFDKDGTKLLSVTIPFNYKDCMPWADKDGNMYLVGRTKDDNTNLIRISSSGGTVDTLLKDIKEGGVLNEEDQMALAPDGTVYIYKTYNEMKVFSADMKMIFRTKESEEDDADALEDWKKKQEDEKEF